MCIPRVRQRSVGHWFRDKGWQLSVTFGSMMDSCLPRSGVIYDSDSILRICYIVHMGVGMSVVKILCGNREIIHA